MSQLKSMGTAQNVKVYRRHGAVGKLFGVSFANLGKLKKQLRTNQALAERLWKTANVDARTLALMIADPEELKASVLDGWLRDIRYPLLAGMLADVVAQSRFADSRLIKWCKSPNEITRTAGYSLVCSVFKAAEKSKLAAQYLDDAACKKILATIEAEIHGSRNQARQAMNGALIAIGIYRPRLTALAKKTAKRIGKVTVDHGETGCKTPDAIAYIDKAVRRKKERR